MINFLHSLGFSALLDGNQSVRLRILKIRDINEWLWSDQGNIRYPMGQMEKFEESKVGSNEMCIISHSETFMVTGNIFVSGVQACTVFQIILPNLARLLFSMVPAILNISGMTDGVTGICT
jgi:hypothetical protein